MMLHSSSLPHWNLTSIFPSLDSPEFTAAFDELKRDVQQLAAIFDRHGIRRSEAGPRDEETAALFEEVAGPLNDLLARLRVARAYVNGFVSTDAAHSAAQALAAELRTLQVALDPLQTRFTAWVGSLDAGALEERSGVARAHEYFVRRAAVLARHQLSESEEQLAAALLPSGLSGWARLHHDLGALHTVRLTLNGAERSLPISAVRALAHDPDREVRRTAFEAELSAWKALEVPLAAALNGIKGYQQVLRRGRSYEDDVAPTLLRNAIDRETLAAMQAACVASFPDFRRYLRARARSLGLERLAWYDLTAPVGQARRVYDWPEAEAFIAEQFGRYSPRLRGLAERAYREGWIDAEPRPGKGDGAFCMGVRPGESRVLMNYDGSATGISTLAHELGHAYHNLNLEPRTELQRTSPSTLNETASTFCEQIAFDAALQQVAGDERLALLETSLQRDLLVVVDIHSRFLFEQAVFERRAARELLPAEFCELMLQSQRATYGDGLDENALHPYMWAVKGHYYGPTFYNYPYTFGLLFGLGLYARRQEDPAGFPARYDQLLSTTGMADAAALAAPFGIDLRRAEFWQSSLDQIRRRINEFETLAGNGATRNA
jgi:pepF/M3 family oligoendopeptidase